MIVKALEDCLEVLDCYDFTRNHLTEEDLTEDDRKDLQLIVDKSIEVVARLKLPPNEKKKLAILSLVRELEPRSTYLNPYSTIKELKLNCGILVRYGTTFYAVITYLDEAIISLSFNGSYKVSKLLANGKSDEYYLQLVLEKLKNVS